MRFLVACRAWWVVLRGGTVVINARLSPDPLLTIRRHALIVGCEFEGPGAAIAPVYGLAPGTVLP